LLCPNFVVVAVGLHGLFLVEAVPVVLPILDRLLGAVPTALLVLIGARVDSAGPGPVLGRTLVGRQFSRCGSDIGSNLR
jgi:hypothetical protein